MLIFVIIYIDICKHFTTSLSFFFFLIKPILFNLLSNFHLDTIVVWGPVMRPPVCYTNFSIMFSLNIYSCHLT